MPFSIDVREKVLEAIRSAAKAAPGTWPQGRAQDGGQREVERAARAQPSVISVLDGDRVGARGPLSFPSLKGRGGGQSISFVAQFSRVAALFV
jgi:hypothetical protein